MHALPVKGPLPLLGNIIHQGGRPSARFWLGGVGVGAGGTLSLGPDSNQSPDWNQSMNAKQLQTKPRMARCRPTRIAATAAGVPVEKCGG